MLDAYIIDRIRREREQQERPDGSFVPLHIENPFEGPPLHERGEHPPEESTPERGSTVIDFHV